MKTAAKRILACALALVIVFSLGTLGYAAQPVRQEKRGFFGWLTDLLGGDQQEEEPAPVREISVSTPAPKADAVPAAEPTDSAEFKVETMDNSYRDDKGRVVIEFYYDLVTLAGEGEAIEAINARIAEDYDSYLDGLAGITDQALQDPWLDPDDKYFTPYLDNVSAAVFYNENGVFSICLTKDWMMGGVRNTDPYDMTFDLATGLPLTLEELFPSMGAALEDRLKDITLEYLYEGGYIEAEQAQGLLDEYTVADFEFYITDGGELVLTYPTYRLTIGAEGAAIVPTGLFIERA